MRRYLRRTPAGLLRVDAAVVKREAHLDGKWLLRTSDTTLTADDLAAAYKQLLQVERGWRDMKGALGLRPVFHYREDRIRAHVQLCWLALLLLRVVEKSTPDGQVAQRSALTTGQKSILTAAQAARTAEVLRLHRRQRLTGRDALTLAVVTRP
jgi:transposase